MGIPGLMQFIPCNIHVAHNAFKVCLHMDIKLKNLPLISFITSGIFHVDEMILQRSKKKLHSRSKCSSGTYSVDG